MRCQEAYQEESTSTRDGTVGNIHPDMDFMHIENGPGSPISRDLVENMRRHQHTVQGDEIYGQYKDEDDTFLEYHSQDEDDNDDD